MTSNRFLRFLLTGGFAALVNLASRYVLNEYMSFEAAVAVAFLFGVSTAYVLAKFFVFDRSDQAVALEFRRFLFVNLIALALVWGISVGLALYVFPAIGLRWHGDTIAHFFGVLSPTIFSYLAHKHYTFRPTNLSSVN